MHQACNKHQLTHRELIVIANVTEDTHSKYVSILGDG